MTRPHLLLTNDDGIGSPGLAALAEALEPVGEVWVYAPDRNQSAVGHGFSLNSPLRVEKLKERWYRIDGTPTDCVILALRDLMPEKPSVLVSGINDGANLGDDVTYSGTVAGAFEGMLLGVPSMAISNVRSNPRNWDATARVAEVLVRQILETGLPENAMLNVNVPDLPYEELGGVEMTRMGRRIYDDAIIRREDPRGLAYYWIGGEDNSHSPEAGTDLEAIARGQISVTPLLRDLTHYEALKTLQTAKITL